MERRAIHYLGLIDSDSRKAGKGQRRPCEYIVSLQVSTANAITHNMLEYDKNTCNFFMNSTSNILYFSPVIVIMYDVLLCNEKGALEWVSRKD